MTTWLIPHFGLKRQYDNLQEELLDATHEALKEGVLINGPFTATLEHWLKEYTGCRFASVTHSGTHALEFIAAYHYDLYLLAGYDESPTISIPNITYPATFNAFFSMGWNVELADTDSNGLMKFDDTSVEYACFVGLYGAPAPGSMLSSSVIVDGAQHWLNVDRNLVGAGMAISFDPTKNLPASGNGGAVVTNDQGLYDWVTAMKNNGKPDHYYAGTNSKMSEIDCSHVLVRAQYINQWQKRRKQIREYYIERFAELPFRCLSQGFDKHADQKFVIYTSERNELQQYLTSKKIETRIHYEQALSELPIARDIIKKPDIISTSVALTKGVLSLPIYPELTDSEVEYIADEVIKFYESTTS